MHGASRWTRDKNNSETHITRLAFGIGIPTGRPQLPRFAAPTAAAESSVRTRGGPLRIDDTAARIRPIPVLAPLPQSAVHVVQAPRVRQLLPHGMSDVVAVVFKPRVSVQ